MQVGQTKGRTLELLASIAAEVRICQLCPLAKGRTMAVPGQGPPDAKIILVGEAPGKDEDLSGVPFVGRAGRLLEASLQTAGIPRNEVYITNLVKCRPPKNRRPKAGEIKICKEAHLLRELDSVRPDTIVLLGRTAVQTFLKADSLGEVRGKLTKRDGYEFFSTFHPAAILRNPRLKGSFNRDLQKIVKATNRGRK